MPDVFCLASNDEDFHPMAECNRRKGHDGHHCDTRKEMAWDGEGEVPQCPQFYDHGRPPNRAARRGNTTLRPRHLARIRRNGGQDW